MPVTIKPDVCCYCGACVGVCPFLALELDEVKIMVDNPTCTDCNICVKVCPVGAIVEDPNKKKLASKK